LSRQKTPPRNENSKKSNNLNPKELAARLEALDEAKFKEGYGFEDENLSRDKI